MDLDKLEHIINVITKGDTSSAQSLFDRPGGRKFLESTVLVLLHTQPQIAEEREDLFIAFVRAMDKIEKRIKRQKEGQKILKQVYD